MRKAPIVFACVVCVGVFAVLYTLAFGVSFLHDYRLWKLERGYNALKAAHPRDTFVVIRKTYLGGPSTHGSMRCNYVVGELRSSRHTKEEIREAYGKSSTALVTDGGRIPLSVLFFDEGTWRAMSPWWEWEDELREYARTIDDTPYFVYVAEDAFFWFDYRCDD